MEDYGKGLTIVEPDWNVDVEQHLFHWSGTLLYKLTMKVVTESYTIHVMKLVGILSVCCACMENRFIGLEINFYGREVSEVAVDTS